MQNCLGIILSKTIGYRSYSIITYDNVINRKGNLIEKILTF